MGDHPMVVPPSVYRWMQEHHMLAPVPAENRSTIPASPAENDPGVLRRWGIPPPGLTWAQWLEATCRRALRRRWNRRGHR